MPPPRVAARAEPLPSVRHDVSPSGFSPEQAIADQLRGLEQWTIASQREVSHGQLRLWLLKLPAFLCALAAAGAQTYGYGRAVVALGAVCALCVAIDAAWPGAGQSAQRRAVQDLRSLQNAVKLRWDKIRLLHPDPSSGARTDEALSILDHVQTRRDEIGRYLGSPQASPDADSM
jgi:hypothetical protein